MGMGAERERQASDTSSLLPAAVRLERLNDSVDQLRKLMERWDNRLTFKGLSIVELYLNGRLKIAVDFEIYDRSLDSDNVGSLERPGLHVAS
jgi:hypothetical protein